MAKILTCYVILHNMIIDDERDTRMNNKYDNVGTTLKPRRHTNHIQAFIEAYWKIGDRDSHDQPREDLTEHQRQLHGR